jgi:hypothetical protein
MFPARSPQASGVDRISHYDIAYADSVPKIGKFPLGLAVYLTAVSVSASCL